MNAAKEIDLVFHALGDPTRRAILTRLSQGPVSVSDLAKPLKVTVAAVTQHLQLLEDSGLVQTKKAGRVRTCALESRGLDLAGKWIAERKMFWEKRLDRLSALLDDED